MPLESTIIERVETLVRHPVFAGSDQAMDLVLDDLESLERSGQIGQANYRRPRGMILRSPHMSPVADLLPLKGHAMTARLAETQLWQQNLASLIRSGLFSKAATGETNGLFTVVGIYTDETCRRPWPSTRIGDGPPTPPTRQSDRPGARAGRLESIGVTVPGSSPTMAARRTAESAMVLFCPRIGLRDRAGRSRG